MIFTYREHHRRQYHHERRALRRLLRIAQYQAQQRNGDQAAANPYDAA
jgi:hypothetical protein